MNAGFAPKLASHTDAHTKRARISTTSHTNNQSHTTSHTNNQSHTTTRSTLQFANKHAHASAHKTLDRPSHADEEL